MIIAILGAGARGSALGSILAKAGNEVTLIDGGADDFVSKSAGGRVLLSRVQRLLYRSLVTT